jgi:hypothetical protein
LLRARGDSLADAQVERACREVGEQGSPGGLRVRLARMLRRTVVFLALAPAAASAETYIELGARLELLDIDEPIGFTCDEPCDTEEDPECAMVPPESLCQDASLDVPHEGWLFGGLVGLHFGPRWASAGARLVGTFGPFEPKREPDPPAHATAHDDEGVTLAHVTLELPLELRAGGEGTHVYLQAVPRVGVLNYLDGRDEEADTFTAGIMFVAGFRFGLDDGSIGLGVGRVKHSSFGGWMGDLVWRSAMRDTPAEPE